jgi:hypothetical protein
MAYVLGDQTGGSTAVQCPPANYKAVIRVYNNTGVSIAIDKLVYYVSNGPTAKVKPIIYADSAGSPGTLLATGDEQIGVATGINTLTFSTTYTMLNGYYYWIGVISDSMVTNNSGDLSGGIKYNANTYTDGPSDPFGSPTTADYSYRMWVEGELVAATNYSLSAVSGSFAETGVAAALKFFREIAAVSGSFAETGTAATLTKRGREIAAGSGAFTKSGTAAGLRATRILVPGSGMFLETGTAAILSRGRYPLAALSGSYVLTGTAINAFFDRLLSANSGELVLAMTPAGLLYTQYTIYAGSGTFLISGDVVYFPRPGSSKACFIFQKRRDHFRI